MPATMKRGERTRLMTAYLEKNPDASKKEVMERFEVSDAMYYNIRKKVKGAKDATSQKQIVKDHTIKSKSCSNLTSVPASPDTVVIQVGGGLLHLCQDGLYFRAGRAKTRNALVTWENLSKLQDSGLFDR